MNKRRAVVAAAAATILAAATAVPSFAAGEFEGVWKVTDTDGKPFKITLSAGGKASADRPSKPMSGTWKEDGSSAVITWDTDWTTKISKEGGKYTKTAYEKGTSAKPTNTSPAEKVK
jgi:hypothetical protein